MNRNQAKLLAPIICAFAAGSAIEARHPLIGSFDWINVPMGIEPNFEHCIQEGIELRIAPKPPKVKLARIALCNLAKVSDENFATFRTTGIPLKAPEEGWLPAEIIVRGGECKSFEQHPTFIKWISEPFKLLPSDKRAHARG